MTPASLQPLVDLLHTLAVEIGQALEGLVSNRNMSGNDAQNGAHIRNSKPDLYIEVEPVVEKTETRPVPLSVVRRACPDIAMYDKCGVETWRDLIRTARLVRGMLGISASAWDAARVAMGEQGAAIVVAGILQRAEAIKSPGGYLRGLTERSRAGEFSAWPMVMALLRAQSPISKSSSCSGGGSRSAGRWARAWTAFANPS